MRVGPLAPPAGVEAARIALHDDGCDAKGEQRTCVALLERPPAGSPSAPAALADLGRMEAAHAGH